MANQNKIKKMQPKHKRRRTKYRESHYDSLQLAADIVRSTAKRSPDFARRLSGGRSIRVSSIKSKRSA